MVVCNGFNTFVLRKNNYNIIKQPWEEHMNTGKPQK